MARPLGLPVGSVRALCLLGLSARCVLDLRAHGSVAPWLVSAVVVSAVSYFSARAARAGTVDAPAHGATPRHPLGLPAGTIRLLFLALAGYGAWLWFRDHPLEEGGRPLVVVSIAFAIGVLVRGFLSQVRRPEDASTLVFEHLQAFVAVASAVGLVAIAVTGRDHELSSWIEPTLGAVCTYYAGVR
ncbi:MAG: hypothetical protein IT460_09470 [Planctomycetes bacterium]|nr:hypothetical protein [Planctomycetota bacterium]